MLEIPDIDPDKVQLYGKHFLKLVKKAQRFYDDMLKTQEDRPQDPNHRNVIDISSDDEMNDRSDFSGNDGFQAERSSYFEAHDAAVERFNAQSK